MALGNNLREAREARGLTTGEVAEHTNMMVQIVEELEKEDFHRIAAPIYGRGFLKLYAELLEIDVQPLINEFMDIYTGKSAPAIQHKEIVSPENPKIPAARMVEKEEEEEEAEPAPEPVPAAAMAEERPEVRPRERGGAVPERAKIVPHQGVRTLEPAPGPALKGNLPAATDEEAQSLFADEESTAPAGDLRVSAADEFEPSPEIPPSADDDLFGGDEPNLFNTSPLQERLAEARRLMEEREEGVEEEKNQKKGVSLHLSPNQRLPVFQIGGRMDRTYEAEPRKSGGRSEAGRSMGSMLKKFSFNLPFELGTGRRSVFVYGALGLIALVFIVSGMLTIYKLTRPSGDESTAAEKPRDAIPREQSRTPVSAAVKSGERKVPPPPDMYFD